MPVMPAQGGGRRWGRRIRAWLVMGGRVLSWAGRRMFATHGFEHAGNLAFLGFLALFPFLIVLVTLAGLLGQTAAGGEALKLLFDMLPARIAETLSRPVASAVAHADEAILTGAILFALWVAVDAVEALTVDLLLVLLAALALVTAMSVLIALPLVVEQGAELLRWGADFRTLARRLELVAAPLILGGSIYLAYRLFTPRGPYRRVFLPGTVFTVLAIWAVAKLFTLFIAQAPRYDVIYGSLAGIMLTQLFFFVVAASFIFGAHLNAAIARRSYADAPACD